MNPPSPSSSFVLFSGVPWGCAEGMFELRCKLTPAKPLNASGLAGLPGGLANATSSYESAAWVASKASKAGSPTEGAAVSCRLPETLLSAALSAALSAEQEGGGLARLRLNATLLYRPGGKASKAEWAELPQAYPGGAQSVTLDLETVSGGGSSLSAPEMDGQCPSTESLVGCDGASPFSEYDCKGHCDGEEKGPKINRALTPQRAALSYGASDNAAPPTLSQATGASG